MALVGEAIWGRRVPGRPRRRRQSSRQHEDILSVCGRRTARTTTPSRRSRCAIKTNLDLPTFVTLDYKRHAFHGGQGRAWGGKRNQGHGDRPHRGHRATGARASMRGTTTPPARAVGRARPGRARRPRGLRGGWGASLRPVTSGHHRDVVSIAFGPCVCFFEQVASSGQSSDLGAIRRATMAARQLVAARDGRSHGRVHRRRESGRTCREPRRLKRKRRAHNSDAGPRAPPAVR